MMKNGNGTREAQEAQAGYGLLVPLVLLVFLIFSSISAAAQASKPSLADLIESGNRKAALDQIRAGADVNAAQPDGTRPIQWAVYKVDYELLSALIVKRANVNVKNEFGSSPITEAAGIADARMIKMLLDAGADPEGANQDGETALMLAIKTGEVPVIDMLIKAGANVNTAEKFHKQTPLMWAVTAPKNAGAMVKLLLAKGADVKPRALYTDWPSQITNEPRAQYRPVGGLTALLYAARDGCYDCIEALIGAGADPNTPTPEGVTPLILALDNDHNDVAKLLLDRGANPKVWDWWGRTPLYVTVDRKEPQSPAGGSRGARGGAAATRRGATAEVSSMDIINTLIAAGVDLNPQLSYYRPSRGGNSGRFYDPLLNTGCTPLFRAAMGGDKQVVQVLLEHGANPNINDMGLTAFLVAAGVGPGNVGGTGIAAQSSLGGPVYMDVMELLLQHGANINDQITGTKTFGMRISRAPSANEGYTALHYAAEAGKADVVRYLLEKGAKTDIVDAKGRKAIELVADKTNPAGAAEIRGLLEKATRK